MSTMSCHGYEAVVESAELFHGEVINLRDVITFQGGSVQELKHALAESVDAYLEFCQEEALPARTA